MCQQSHGHGADCVNKETTTNNVNSSPEEGNSGPAGGSSGAGFEVSKASQITSASNVYFSDADSPWHYEISSNLDSTYNTGMTSDASLATFLSRPIKIFTTQWTPSAQLFDSFNPWKEYFDDFNVLQKLNRFRNLRCNMCLKIMLNGNPFYYGRALLSYNPYRTNDDVTLNRAFFEEDLVGASQKPHVLLDPCSSQGAEMCIPFIYPENWFDITEANWTSDLGLVTIHDFDVLQHANGGVDPISVNVFAWCENVELCIPTAAQVQSGPSDLKLDEFGYPIFEAQAGGPKKSKSKRRMTNTNTNDEFKSRDGLISKPASAVANAANALSMIPFLAPYAKATSMVATKVGQIAKLFGYSRPNILGDTHVYVPRYAGNMSNTDAPENLVKLSVDSKNELTIDSRVNGMDGADELTIMSIASRESYVTQFDWPELAVTDSHLFSIQVDPMVLRTLSVAPVNEVHNTALSFATLPFQFWQGSIKFRFQVVCSEYHRGRLRIVYDPRQNNDESFNVAYSTVVDITEDRDFEYEVKWTQPRAWQNVRTLNGAAANVLFSTAATPPAVNTDFNNGQLSVYVLNELATPSVSPADIKILVWISAGDDFAVSVPRSELALDESSYFQQQAEWVVYDAQGDDAILATTQDESNTPVDSAPVPTFGSSYIPEDNQYLVYQGERVLSFRDLMRRYYYHTSYMNNTDGTGYGLRRYFLQDFPKFRGWDPNGSEVGVNSLAANAPFTYARVPLFQYLAPAFVCRRGAMRVKYILNTRPDFVSGTTATISRIDTPGVNQTGYSNIATASTLLDSGAKAIFAEALGTGSGAFVTPIGNNPTFELELPFYTRGQRFVPARDITWNTGRDHYGRHSLSSFADFNTTSDSSRWDAYWSVGEDFNLSCFVGAPVMFTYSDPTPGT